jgi:hypothetical protein
MIGVAIIIPESVELALPMLFDLSTALARLIGIQYTRRRLLIPESLPGAGIGGMVEDNVV